MVGYGLKYKNYHLCLCKFVESLHSFRLIDMKSLQKLPEVKDTNDPDKMVMLVGEILKDPREDKKIISKVAKSVCIP